MSDYVANRNRYTTMQYRRCGGSGSGDNEYPRPVSKGQSLGDNSGYGVWVRDTRNPTDIGFRSVTLAPKDTRAQGLPNYDDKAWHHVLLSINGKQGTLYLDGEAIADQAVKGDYVAMNLDDGQRSYQTPPVKVTNANSG